MSKRDEAGSLMTEWRPGLQDILASDADREAAAGQLSSALAEGRLTASEHEERVGAAYAARTLVELETLTADLPAPARPAVGSGPAAIHSEVDRCLLCALLILCPPAGIAWLLVVRRRSRTGGSQPLAAAVTADELRAVPGAIRPCDAVDAGLESPAGLRLGGADAEDR